MKVFSIMVLIRIFRTRRQAEAARKILEQGGIYTTISEDKFEGVPIQKYGVPARFRLNAASKNDWEKAATFLAKRLKPRKS